MTKSDIINEIHERTGIERVAVGCILEELMTTIKDNMTEGENIYLRGFGTFFIKTRNEKIGRNITAGTSLVVPEHNIPAFKPCKEFKDKMKDTPINK